MMQNGMMGLVQTAGAYSQPLYACAMSPKRVETNGGFWPGALRAQFPRMETTFSCL